MDDLGHAIPRSKPKTVEYYPGEVVTEPDPCISNRWWTGKIINGMVSKGWTMEQIHEVLSNPVHAGGAYYRFRATSDTDGGTDYLKHMYENSWAMRASNESNCVTTSTQGDVVTQLNTPRTKGTWLVLEDGFHIKAKAAERLLLFLKGEETIYRDACNSGEVHPRAARKYLAALGEASLITITEERRPAKDKKMRWQKVIRTASPETAESVLGTANVPDGDRRLWVLLKPLEPRVHFNLTLEELLNA